MRSRSTLAFAFAFVVAVGGAPAIAHAELCDETEAKLRSELALRFSGPDDPGTRERRNRLQVLFAAAPPACAKALYERLGERPTDDELSERFHYALATPTRASLRDLLRNDFEPLDVLDAAIDADVAGAAARDHLKCWVEKLRLGRAADTRTLPWKNICPTDEQSCPARAHASPDEIAAKIHSADDVENTTPASLQIFQFLDLTIDMALVDRDTKSAIASLLDLRNEIAETNRRLSGDGLPPHYRAMAEWIAAKEAEPASVLFCPP
jgi:hypothetical protein